jgi:hypothetical protein
MVEQLHHSLNGFGWWWALRGGGQGQRWRGFCDAGVAKIVFEARWRNSQHHFGRFGQHLEAVWDTLGRVWV